MGCGAGKKVIQDTSSPIERSKFCLKVMKPDNQVVEFKYENERNELPLTFIMNMLLFDSVHSGTFNACFISKFSHERKRFQYFIQKLVGISMENEDHPYQGKQWVVYHNENKTEWDIICEKEINVKPLDSIRFQYELLSH